MLECEQSITVPVLYDDQCSCLVFNDPNSLECCVCNYFSKPSPWVGLCYCVYCVSIVCLDEKKNQIVIVVQQPALQSP